MYSKVHAFFDSSAGIPVGCERSSVVDVHFTTSLICFSVSLLEKDPAWYTVAKISTPWAAAGFVEE